jgi:hypothetical protein
LQYQMFMYVCWRECTAVLRCACACCCWRCSLSSGQLPKVLQNLQSS